MLAFVADYKPHVIILGGDVLDLGAISHWNAASRLNVEGLRIQQDVDEFASQVMAPLEDIGADQFFISGNHERFLQDLTARESGLADTLTIPKLLNLDARGWHYTPTGGHLDIGKLRFVHGDQLSGGDAVAKVAVRDHHKSIMAGHYHTHQQFVTHSPVDSRDTHIGIIVPALCNRGPEFMKKRANKWATGFAHGVFYPNGSFCHYITLITDGRFYANGRTYGN